MKQLQQLITENEEWLMRRILHYAKEHDYVKYTSTLAEAWRISIENLSRTLGKAAGLDFNNLELHPEEDYTQDPFATFGILEAQKHRSRGLTLGMFLSLLKYYRQSYIDLIQKAGFDLETCRRYELIVARCFDRIELGLCTEWAEATNKERFNELQASNRFLANEKNKYLTIFESLHDPVILLDNNNEVTNMNYAAAKLLIGSALPGDIYYDLEQDMPTLPWLDSELATFSQSGAATFNFEKTLSTAQGLRLFSVKLERMLDISEKFSGVVVLLYDLTESKRAAIVAERERLARELHDSVTQSLYSLSLFAEWGKGLLAVGDTEAAQERMARIGDISQQALREMRLLLYELRPSTLDEDGLVGAIENRLTAVEKRVGVSAQLQANLAVDLLPHVEECIYRIAQEALNNALKHAEATAVLVQIQTHEGAVILNVTDDGKGFDRETVTLEGRMGLSNMHARAERLGGILKIESKIGSGTTISLHIPQQGKNAVVAPNGQLLPTSIEATV
jgi:signal transduction histidine kinase